jgi:hypothetical protein
VIEAGVPRRFNVRIPLRDGVTLSADLALPEALPAPTVVVRTPYGKTGERNSQRAAMFAKAGYVCALVDVRGRGDSDGAFQPYRNDGPDGAEVIAWAAAQDWCAGHRRGHDHRNRGGHRHRPALAHALPPVAAHPELTTGPGRALPAGTGGTGRHATVG